MKTPAIKKIAVISIAPETKQTPSKPRSKTNPKLSKADPDYYKIIGKISAKKRKIPREQFAEWARKGHETRDKSTYRGGRPKGSAKSQ